MLGLPEKGRIDQTIDSPKEKQMCSQAYNPAAASLPLKPETFPLKAERSYFRTNKRKGYF